ncbi:MAG TPA: HEAT repeat domain-containing protein, partial [Polyangia bacterium]
RITPDPVPAAPTGGRAPLLERLGALDARLANLEAVLAGRPGELRDRVRGCARLCAETAQLLGEAGEGEAGEGEAGEGGGERPAPADPQHPAADAARRAIRALEQGAEPSQELRRALAALTHPRREVRLEALAHLGDPPDPAALPVLTIVARAADPAERRAIVAAVRRMGPAARGSPLVATALGDADAAVRLHAVRAAAGSSAAVPRLEELAAADPSAAVRRLSVGVLLQCGAPRRAARIGQGLRDPDPGVRLSTIEAAAASQDPAAVLPLIRALVDPAPAIGAAAARALGRLGLDVGGVDPGAPVAARRETASRLRREWAAARFADAPAPAAAAVLGDGDLDDPLGAEFLVSPGGRDGGDVG